ncbi:xanthine dehydrogenase family protein molybdopterin-binding subunit [Acetobacter fallax]|uniref:Molybdopterin-dependent oxidoreductase n=1 Tax=Acetobacter fallax TaxID=1737473 RepID=A0ABX0KHT4_9PROT|nr:xanthine dehydrogenase family protein molybdopterin-binding subunit [Acetobacter fallax]NHO33467.1 molybdopterin-dependent oxidoreductase [Acetobacter fallax]NHO37053.1 molybdopterin-dependent oxidoreductase [Acetobacter fallax]
MTDTLPKAPLDTPFGPGIDRVEGPLKVTGTAPYANEHTARRIGSPTHPLVGFMVLSTIAKGRLVSLDTTAARTSPGVRLVLTRDNAPPQNDWGPLVARDRFARSQPALHDDRIRFFGQPVALVVADTLETARAAAQTISATYEPETPAVTLDEKTAIIPPTLNGFKPTRTSIGDFRNSYAASAAKLDVTYETPHQSHAQMEPHATTALWDANGEHVTLWTSNQILNSAQKGIASTLQLKPEQVRIVGLYVGGGFGGKLPWFDDALLAAIAARMLKCPVRVAMTRQQMFTATTHRTATRQRIRIGAARDGHLRAIAHDALSHCASFDNFVEDTTTITRGLYGADAITTSALLNKLDLPRSDSMRAPGDAVGMIALECGLDEIAHTLGMDPVALRLANDTQTDPTAKRPFSSRKLAECLRTGATRFNWSARNPTPGQHREGEWLIGTGMASAMRYNLVRPSQAEIILSQTGHLTVRMAMTDPGTGTITILARIASEATGIPPDRITVTIGDTDFPPAAGSGGSFGAESAGSALYNACETLRLRLARTATTENGPLANIPLSTLSFSNASLTNGTKTIPLTQLVPRDGLTTQGSIKPGNEAKDWSQASFGAHFAEVAVSAVTGETRVRRMTGVFACGRILNARTARSQAIGGMIWGISAALFEANPVDPRSGQFTARDLANYHVASHADAPHIDATFLPEDEPVSNPLHIKGIGEVGICGAPAAIGNAIFNATGIRIRNFPITPDKLLPHLPEISL